MQQRFTLDALFIAMCLLGNPLKDNHKYVQTWIMSHFNCTLIECLGAHYLQYTVCVLVSNWHVHSKLLTDYYLWVTHTVGILLYPNIFYKIQHS